MPPLLTCYRYRYAIGGFFEFPTESARRILPKHLEPAELHHGSSILSITAFDFTESEVGAYGEVVMAVIVAPLVRPGERLPKAAFYPYQVATTTEPARDHAIERWHLPHWTENVGLEFDHDGGVITARVTADGAMAAELTVTDHSWNSVSHLYQSFMNQGRGTYLASITMAGQHSEHEEEAGRIKLFDHPFNRDLTISEIRECPFRELWMRDGVQIFQPLVQLQSP